MKKQNSEDKYYEELSRVDLEELKANNQVSMRGHSWVQKGTQLECRSCTFKHSTYVPPNLKLTGINDDGTPILEEIKY